jgi:2OG-Fe(II) oxygenase superfamily
MNFINPSYGNLTDLAKAYKDTYENAEPFANISFKNFFNEEMLNGVLAEFADLDKGDAIAYNTPNEIKWASQGENRLGPKAKAFVHFLNSEPFLCFLQELTSIEETLIPDSYLQGGGFHQIKTGGYLKIHADFNKHRLTKLDRRVNVLVYLNKNWQEDYGGHLEMWNKDMTQCVKKVLPEFGTMALFSTTDYSFHGLPNPLTCPPDRSRKSLALYYYSNGRPSYEINDGLEDHSTIFRARRGTRDDDAMKNFNKVQFMKHVMKDWTPPFITRAAKKVLKGNI